MWSVPRSRPTARALAYKQLIGSDGRTNTPVWRLAVLELATLIETPLAAEPLSVDDQVERLDDDHILYALPDYARPRDPAQVRPVGVANIWILPLGGGAPRLFLAEADSPAVER